VTTEQSIVQKLGMYHMIHIPEIHCRRWKNGVTSSSRL